ncbi:MAG TPA: hypothetical protein VEH06_13080 [Candidatus Bathyarchaeia archaeon]|nr:hypothetical protein [Candidatus Bathyarchaeia archaeon]
MVSDIRSDGLRIVAQAATITDFKMTGTPTTKGKATTYNGTATISLKHGPINNTDFYKTNRN